MGFGAVTVISMEIILVSLLCVLCGDLPLRRFGILLGQKITF